MPVKQQSSRWSRNTSNKRSNCSKGTNSSSSSCSRNSNRRTGIGPNLRTRAVLQLKTLIVYSTTMEREPSEASTNRMPCSVTVKNFSEARAIQEFRRTGCVTRLDAVPLRTSLKQGKRQKPVPHHRPALTGRKSSMGAFPCASGAPLRLPRFRSGFPHKSYP